MPIRRRLERGVHPPAYCWGGCVGPRVLAFVWSILFKAILSKVMSVMSGAMSAGMEDYRREHPDCADDGASANEQSALVATKRSSPTAIARQESTDKLTAACRTIIECVGEDPDREGLVKTPERMAKALKFFTSGYEQDLKGSLQFSSILGIQAIFSFRLRLERHGPLEVSGKVRGAHSAFVDLRSLSSLLVVAQVQGLIYPS